MAKKAKKKLEEDDDYKAFHFPHFDVVEFIHYELEQTSATVMAVVAALAVALLSWGLTVYGMGIQLEVAFALVSLMIGFVVMGLFPFLVRWAREKAPTYRTGDWATLLLIYLFLWLGIWNLLLNA